MLLSVEPDGSPIVEMPNRDIPVSVILELHQLRGSELSLEDVVTNIRVSLVPPGYEPCPFGSNTDESLIDTLRPVVTTYRFRKRVEELKEQGVDFSSHIYVSEIDPDPVHHEHSDYKHLLNELHSMRRMVVTMI